MAFSTPFIFFNILKFLFKKYMFHQKYPHNSLLMLLAVYLVKTGRIHKVWGGDRTPFFRQINIKK